MLLQKSLHSLYIQTKYNDKEEIINNTSIKYVEPLLDDINHPAFIQEWKRNLNAAAYENKYMLTCIKIQQKNKLIIVIATRTGQPQ